MKRVVVLSILLLSSVLHTAYAQEFLVTEINKSNFEGIIATSGMERVFFVPYFSTNENGKRNFTAVRINQHTFQEEDRLTLELPSGYQLLSASFSGGAYLLAFYDKDKKEDILISASNNNIRKKESRKHFNGKYLFNGTPDPESFLLIELSDKGDYSITQLNLDLESKWEKEFSPKGATWQVLDVEQTMEGLSITRKETTKDGKYSFHKQMFSGDSGDEMFSQNLNIDTLKAYPTFFSSREGMSFTGGYYYNSGVAKGQADGIFMAMLTPDGQYEQVVKVPLSQVVEDLKGSVGGKLLDENTTITFTDGLMSHETQSLVMSGQVFTRKIKENGTDIALGDIITLKFNLEKGYSGANVIDIEGNNVTLKGNTANINTIDLGVWLKKASILQAGSFVPMPGSPIISYVQLEGANTPQVCYKNAALKTDTNLVLCTPITDEPQSTDMVYTYSPDIMTYPQLDYGIITDRENISTIVRYNINNEMLKIQRTEVPQLERIMVHMPPEEPEEEPMDEPEEEPMDEPEEAEG